MSEDLASVLAEHAADFDTFRTRLDADLWCAALLAALGREDDDGDAAGALRASVEAVLDLVAERPTTEAVAFLRAVAMAIPDDLAPAVETAVGTAVDAGVAQPPWASTGTLRAGPCWHAERPGQFDLVSVVLRRGREEHVFSVEIVPPGVVVDIALSEDGRGTHREHRSLAGGAGIPFADLDFRDARARLVPALARPPQFASDDEPAASPLRTVLRAALVEAVPAS